MGVVYEAFDRHNQAQVALKTLLKVERIHVDSLRRGFRALTRVVHENLTTVYELFSDGEEWFFTMEFVEGQDLLAYVSGDDEIDADRLTATETWMADRDDGAPPTDPHRPPGGDRPRAHPSCPADIPRLRNALSQLCQAVCVLHDAGILHRDLKPSNVLVTREGRVKILDYGLAHMLRPSAPEESSIIPVAGTPAYMAPEHVSADPTEASDWYAVGVILYLALTGHLPFSGSAYEMLERKQVQDVPRPSTLVDGIPPDLDDLCIALLSRRPDTRPPGREVLRRLGVGWTPGTVSTDPDHPIPFVGRDRELGVLHNAFDAVTADRTQAVFVHGASGIGKSKLVEYFLEDIRGNDDTVILSGRCYEQESVPYKSLDSVVHALSRHLQKIPRRQVKSLLPIEIAALATVFPALRGVEVIDRICRRDGLDRRQKLDVHTVRQRAFAALRSLLANLGQHARLVVHVDDLQWGDEDGTELLVGLLRPPLPPRLLLIVAYRSHSDAAGKPGVANDAPAAALPPLADLRHEFAEHADCDCVDLSLAELSTDEALRLAQLLAGRDRVSPGRLEAIASEAGCVPFYVHELVAYATSASGPADSETVTLDGLVRKRLSELAPAPRRLLEVIAVSGQPLRTSAARQASDIGEHAPTAFVALRANRLIRGQGDAVEVYHDRIRETIVADLALDSERLREHHARLAAALRESGAEPEQLAMHYLGADDREEAARQFAAAAERAAAALAFARAAALYELARTHGRMTPEALHQLRVQEAKVLANAGRVEEAALAYQDVCRAPEMGDASLRLETQAAYFFSTSGHVDEGQTTFRRVLDRVGLWLPRSPLQKAGALLGAEAMLRTRGLQFQARRAIDIPQAQLDRVDVAWSAAKGFALIDTLNGAYFTARSLLLALSAGEPHRVARSLFWEAASLGTWGPRGRQRGARLLRSHKNDFQRTAYTEALLTLCEGLLEFSHGRWRKASERLSAAEQFLLSPECQIDALEGVAWELGVARTFGLYALIDLGAYGELQRRTPVLLKDANERGDLWLATNLGVFIHPTALLAADRPEDARSLQRRALDTWVDASRGRDAPAGAQGRLTVYFQQNAMAALMRSWVELYEGHGPEAWQFIQNEWPLLKKSYVLHIESIRTYLLDAHARCALAAAETTANPEPLLRLAEQDATTLERGDLRWGYPLADVARAGVAALRNETTAARCHLERSIARFDEQDMGLFAATARRRLGEFLGDPHLVRAGDDWMAREQVRNPERMTDLHVNGFRAHLAD